MAFEEVTTKCCVVGGGPAGMMAGFLLARAGVDVVVLEKHGDFLRDFRGDTVHPSTLELMLELGLLPEFLKLPHQELSEVKVQIGSELLTLADFSHLPTRCKFLAFMPQWDFLKFLADEAAKRPSFSLKMNAEVTGLIEREGKVCGVIAQHNGSELRVNADLVIGADGRGSAVRRCATFLVQDVGAPMDVLWMRLSRNESDPPETMGRVNKGTFLIMLNRGEYWQCGFVIPKGTLAEYQEEGIEEFRKRIGEIAPFVADRVQELKSFDDIKLLTVKVDRLDKWYRDGLLCIGDSAHAMSPVGGVGINLAIQDAVAAANVLWKPLSEGNLTEEHLLQVQQRRTYPTRMTQRLQVSIQNNVVKRVLGTTKEMSVPLAMRALKYLPALQGLPARVIGIGFRPEHIHCPDIKKKVKTKA